jgi:hypothetical protein
VATSKVNVLDFLAQKSSIAGCVFAAVAMVVSGVGLDVDAPLTLGLGIGGWIAGFLIFSDSKQTISIESENSKVELATIQANINKLRLDMEQHSKKIPDEITSASENIFTTLEEIIPRWEELNSFSDQKYVINSIITEYFPESITSYMNLPKSYYRNGAKSQAADEIMEQLGIMLKALEKIRDSLYAGVENDIKTQSRFLKERFVTSEESSSLRLK